MNPYSVCTSGIGPYKLDPLNLGWQIKMTKVEDLIKPLLVVPLAGYERWIRDGASFACRANVKDKCKTFWTDPTWNLGEMPIICDYAASIILGIVFNPKASFTIAGITYMNPFRNGAVTTVELLRGKTTKELAKQGNR